MKRFEYVMSGLAHVRVTLKSAKEDEQSRKAIRAITDRLGSLLEDHKITGLYNAFTEVRNGKNVSEGEHFETPLHSDSGGLQIISRGLTINEDLKKKVYKNQALYSGTAMCFDEIPTTVTRVASQRLFLEDQLEDKAKGTALNVIEQIKVFDSMKAVTKPLLVVQGNDIPTYLKWIDICLNTIPKEMWDKIGGLSIASTSSGSGALEDIEKNYAFSIAEVPDSWKSQLHLLGIGAIKRMFPVIGFVQSGMIGENTLVSYDSTTHSSNVTHRRFNEKDASFVEVGQDDRFQILKLYEYCKEYYDIKADFDLFCDSITYNRDFFLDKYGEGKIHLWHEALLSMAMVSVLHTTKNVEELAKSNKKFKTFTNMLGCSEMSYLAEIKTAEDYEAYMREFSGRLTTSRIKKASEASSLEQFF